MNISYDAGKYNSCSWVVNMYNNLFVLKGKHFLKQFPKNIKSVKLHSTASCVTVLYLACDDVYSWLSSSFNQILCSWIYVNIAWFYIHIIYYDIEHISLYCGNLFCRLFGSLCDSNSRKWRTSNIKCLSCCKLQNFQVSWIMSLY